MLLRALVGYDLAQGKTVRDLVTQPLPQSPPDLSLVEGELSHSCLELTHSHELVSVAPPAAIPPTNLQLPDGSQPYLTHFDPSRRASGRTWHCHSRGYRGGELNVPHAADSRNSSARRLS